MTRFWALAVLLVGMAAPVAGDVEDEIEIRLAAEPEAVRPGQEFTLSIYTDMPWDIGVHVPRYFHSIGPFTIIEGYQAKPVPVADRRRSHATYRLQAPAESGSYEIEGMTAYVQLVRMQRPGDCERGPDREFVTVPGAGSPFDECREERSLRINRVMQGDRFEMTSPPLVVVVYDHVPPDANTMDPLSIAPPVPLPPAAETAVWRWVAGAVGLVALAGAAILVQRRRRPVAPSPGPVPEKQSVPAGDIARAALARLRDGLAGEGRPAPAAPFELAAVLRTYIDQRLGLPAPRRTTEETVSQLPAVTDGAGLSAEALAQNAEETLAICDLAKFAGRAATREDMETALGAAEAFVSESLERPA